MSKPDFTDDAMMGKLPEIISWLESLGVPARNSRYARYEKHIDQFFETSPDERPDGGDQSAWELILLHSTRTVMPSRRATTSVFSSKSMA